MKFRDSNVLHRVQEHVSPQGLGEELVSLSWKEKHTA